MEHRSQETMPDRNRSDASGLPEETVPAVRIRGLNCHYGGTQVLFDIDATFPAGSITVIAGRSGCGKTTLLRNILRLVEPSSGRIEVFGDEITSLREDELMTIRPRLGVLFQNGALLQSATIGANVAVPLEQHTRLSSDIIERIVLRKLQLVDLGGSERMMPSELSGGMKKRAALARTLALDPEIVFFDEPSAGLDPVTAASLDGLILELSRKLGITVVVVTHELTSIRRISDRMLFIENGYARFEGPLGEAMESDIPALVDFFSHGTPSRRDGCE
ncbi:MAG: ABC transporter ATP-binding protein [Spirochaetales bacterium]